MHELEGDQLEAALLKPADDATDESALDAVGLCNVMTGNATGQTVRRDVGDVSNDDNTP